MKSILVLLVVVTSLQTFAMCPVSYVTAEGIIAQISEQNALNCAPVQEQIIENGLGGNLKNAKLKNYTCTLKSSYNISQVPGVLRTALSWARLENIRVRIFNATDLKSGPCAGGSGEDILDITMF